MDLVSGCLSFTCGSFTLTMWYGLVRTRTRRVYDTVDIVYIIYKHTHLIIIEGSLKVKLPTIWTDGKAEVGRVREEKVIKKKIREEKSQKKEDAGARKGRKVAIHCVFPECVAMVPVSFWGPGSWGCVRSTLRSRSQPSAWGPYGRAYGKFCWGAHF